MLPRSWRSPARCSWVWLSLSPTLIQPPQCNPRGTERQDADARDHGGWGGRFIYEIRDFLSAADVAIEVRAADKAGLLRALAGRAAAAVNLPPDLVAILINARTLHRTIGVGDHS